MKKQITTYEFYCDNCNKQIHEEEIITHNGYDICEDCFEELDLTICSCCEASTSNEDLIPLNFVDTISIDIENEMSIPVSFSVVAAGESFCPSCYPEVLRRLGDELQEFMYAEAMYWQEDLDDCSCKEQCCSCDEEAIFEMLLNEVAKALQNENTNEPPMFRQMTMEEFLNEKIHSFEK